MINLLLVFLLTAGKGPLIACTIPPITSLVEAVGGNEFEYVTVLPAGVNPHTYEPSPKQLLEAGSSRLMFAAGLGIDSWAVKFKTGDRRIAELGKSLKEEGARIRNPHFWLNPQLGRRSLFVIALELSRMKPEKWDYFYERACEYSKKIDSMVIHEKSRIERLKNRRVIVYHDAWEDFAEAFGLEVIDIIAKNPALEPTFQEIKGVIEKGKENGVKAVLREKPFPGKLPETVASEIGAKAVEVDPLFSGDYIEGLRANLLKIEEALK